MMIIFILLIVFFLLFLVDLPILYRNQNKQVLMTYSFLMVVAFAIAIITVKDLPVASPAHVIEKLIKAVIER